MGTAAAGWLISKVLNILTDDLVAAFVYSKELGLNAEKIRQDLNLASGLLKAAEKRGVQDNDGLRDLVQDLSTKAHEADDALDELHYFIIEDQLNNTRRAVPDLGDDLLGHVRHGRHAVRHSAGNWLTCLSCSCVQDDDNDNDRAAPTNNPCNATNPQNIDDDGPTDTLPFDRVAMSKKIKSVIGDLNTLCESVYKLLSVDLNNSTTAAYTLNRSPVGSMVSYKLYGRSVIFEQTVHDITTGMNNRETLSVLPIVGPGGIGKTTFTQHLYKDKRIQEHFAVRIWISAPTDFDLFKLSQQILSCIELIEGTNNTNQTKSFDQLQQSIAQKLGSKRFLIVFDDMWKCNRWESLLAPFMEGVVSKGNMVLVTTRIPAIANRVKTTDAIALKGLEPDEFFTFFEALIYSGTEHKDYRHDLTDVARKLSKKLKGSPLAAKTVGQLLKRNFHWNIGWEFFNTMNGKKEQSEDDIMPSLRISYHNLPFDLKKCFSYFCLFPQDHKFKNLEITYFWIAIGIIDKDDNYMEKLVDNGFLVKEIDHWSNQYYLLHDLLHELSRTVSSQECLNIYSSVSFRADAIPRSVRHLSITMENKCDGNFKEEMAKLKSRINIRNLRTLMIFRTYMKTIDDIVKDTFEEIGGLRVLFIDMSYAETLPKNFAKLLHLRYLKITSVCVKEMSLLSALPRFYHLMFLDLLSWYDSAKLPEHISRLVNLRHFIAPHELHSNVPEVGKIEHLEELLEFHVKKESVGFELEQLGKLADLGGELCVRNLEKVATKEEADKAKLVLKRNLKRLELVWGTDQELVMDADVADGLQPHDNLKELVITDHGAGVGPPSWLCHDIPIRNLECLILTGVSWRTLPPFAQLPYLKILCLKSIAGVHIIGPDLSFMHLKKVSFDGMPDLENWVVGPNCHLFPMLETIEFKGCPNFNALPFTLECLAPCTQDIHYPSLSSLSIDGCSKLPLPPAPHTSTLKEVRVDSDLGYMWYRRGEGSLILTRYSGALAFHNMGKIEHMTVDGIPKFSWTRLQEITSLGILCISKNSGIQSVAFLSSITSLTTLSLVDCENLTVDGFDTLIIAVNLKALYLYNSIGSPRRSIAAELLSEVASRIKLSNPAAGSFFQLETLCVDSMSAVLSAPICSLLAPTLKSLGFMYDDRAESFTKEEEKALQLLRYLRELRVCYCPAIRALPKGASPLH